jgi:GH25 family lysozyme M1 (1,4-beta-N-acetylmuramidase)
MISGADISDFQGVVDFAQVKASGCSFIFAQASDGASPDSNFKTYHDGAKAAGIPFGAYHFFRFNEDPVIQAASFLSLIDGYAGTLLPMIDVELADGASTLAERIANLATFNAAVEKTLNGKKAIIYTGPGFWNDPNGMNGTDAFAGHSLWVAQYGGGPKPTVFAPEIPNGWTKALLWQWTGTGSVPGITGDVDLDLYNGDELGAISR